VADTNLGTAYSSLCLSRKSFKKSEAPQINKDSSPLSVLMFFTEIFHLLVEHILPATLR
jgi:hypothetical protein